MTANPHKPETPSARRDMTVAAVCGCVVAMMIGLTYASVPFYDWFCRTTGYRGDTQVSQQAPARPLARTMTVRFDSNVAPGLPWKFEPEQNEIKLKIGEVATVHYKVTNLAARAITAQAGYNVSPPQAGSYFDKINCFCFTQQTMQPGESREMAVVFYIDPAIAKDREQDDLNTVTLSYTFYRLPDAAQPVADAAAAKPNKL
jgi:cytochrome c oxidase assembly protein subunit 11